MRVGELISEIKRLSVNEQLIVVTEVMQSIRNTVQTGFRSLTLSLIHI